MSDQLAPVVADEIERRLDEVWDRLRALGYDADPGADPHTEQAGSLRLHPPEQTQDSATVG